MKRYITDSGFGLTQSAAERMGLIYIPHNILYNGEPIEDIEGVVLNETYLKVAAPNAEQYRAVFEQYPDDELIYITWSQRTKVTQTFDQIRKLNIPNLTMVDSGFMAEAQLEVTKRIMDGKPYDDIKHFFIVKNTTTGWIPIVRDKFCLFTMDNGQFKLLETFDTRFAAIAKLKRHVNTRLYYRREMNSVIGLHCGADYVGGMHIKG
ncbi:MAG: hypothetical protein FWE38_03250 [Firmicutes bacterium]|nr:hypothetical protein [Bacillota bacterium]